MHAYRQQHKQKKIDQHKMGPKPEQPSPESPAALSGPARDAAARATRGRGRRARSPHTIAALWPRPGAERGRHASAGCPTRTTRIRTPRTTPGTRHTQ